MLFHGVLVSTAPWSESAMCVYIYPLLLGPPSHLHPHPTPLGHHRAPSWAPVLSNHLPLSSVQFNGSGMSDSLQPHGLQHTRIPCPSPTHVHRVSDAISSSVVSFPSYLQSFSASGSFPVGQFFTSGGQSIGVPASASVLPMNTQDWSPLGWTGWISLQSKGPSESSPTSQFKSINSLALSFLHCPTLTSMHDHWKNHSL